MSQFFFLEPNVEVAFFFGDKITIFSGFGIFFSKLYKDSRKRLQIDCGEQNG